MSLEMTLIVTDKGTVVVKKFTDTSKKNLNSLDKQTKKTVKGQENLYKKAGNFVRAFKAQAFLALGGAGVAGMLAKLASSAEETRSKFDAVFKNLAGSSRLWAEDFGDSVGRATSDVEKWMAQLQDTFVPLGFARDKAAEMSKQLVKLGVDVASFNNKADPEVINNFASALVGSTRAVLSYGIVLTETELKQEALNQGINKNIQDLTAAEKAQLRFNLILKSTQDAQGDAIRTGQSFINQVKEMKGEAKETGEKLGEFLVPAFTELVKIAGKAADEIEKVIDLLTVEVGAEKLKAQIIAVENELAKLESTTKNQQKEVDTLNKIWETSSNTVQEIGDFIHFTIEGMKLQFDETKKVEAALTDQGLVLGVNRDTLQQMIDENENFAKAIATGNIDIVNRKMALKGLLESLKEQLRITEQTNKSLEKREVEPGMILTEEDRKAFIEWENLKTETALSMAEKRKQAVFDEFAAQREMLNNIKNERQKAFDTYIKQQEQYLTQKQLMEQTDLEWHSEIANAKMEVNKSLIGSFANLTDAFSRESKTAFEISKALAISETLVNTYAAAQAAYKAMAGIPIAGPALGVAAAASAIITGLANVKKITAQSFEKGGIVAGGRSIRGTNEVLIGAHPGEGIISRRSMERLGSEGFESVRRGEIPKGNTFNINITTQSVDENFTRTQLAPLLNRLVDRGSINLKATEII